MLSLDWSDTDCMKLGVGGASQRKKKTGKPSNRNIKGGCEAASHLRGQEYERHANTLEIIGAAK